jgi:hypothetical protein
LGEDSGAVAETQGSDNPFDFMALPKTVVWGRLKKILISV